MTNTQSTELENHFRGLQTEQNPEQLQQHLNAISIFIHSKQAASQLSQLKGNLNPFVLFSILERPNITIEIVESSSQILEALFNLDPQFLEQVPLDIFIKGLDSPIDSIRKLSWSQLGKALKRPALKQTILQSTEIFPKRFLENIEKSSLAATIFADFFLQLDEADPTVLQSGSEFDKQLQSFFQHANDKAQFKIYDVFYLACKSRPVLLATMEYPLSYLIEKFRSTSDVLIQLNTLESLSKFVSFPEGLTIIEKKELIPLFWHQLTHLDFERAENGLLGCELVRFFGVLFKTKPQLLIDLDNSLYIVEHLRKLLNEQQDTMLEATLVAIGLMTSTYEGLQFTRQHSSRLFTMLRDKCHNCRTTRERAPYVKCFSLMFSQNQKEASSLLFQFYQQLNLRPSNLEYFMMMALVSFFDTRQLGLEMLTSLANHIWAVKKMTDFEVFTKYLFNRQTEFSHEGKLSKFELVRTIQKTIDQQPPELMEWLSPALRAHLQVFIRQGPFYMESSPEVAMESSQ